MTTTDEARQRAYDQDTAESYHDRHGAGEEGEHELALELLLMLARYGLLSSNNNNIGQCILEAGKLKKLMKKLGLQPAFVWLQTKGKRSMFPYVQVMNAKGAGKANRLSSATHVAIVARRHTA